MQTPITKMDTRYWIHKTLRPPNLITDIIIGNWIKLPTENTISVLVNFHTSFHIYDFKFESLTRFQHFSQDHQKKSILSNFTRDSTE